MMDDYLNQSRKYSFSFNDVVHLLFTLLIAKCLKAFGIYLCYDLLKHIHIVQLHFFSLLVASVFFVLLQRPFATPTSPPPPPPASNHSSSSSSSRIISSHSGSASSSHGNSNQPIKRLQRPQYLRLVKYATASTFIKLLWLFGLTQCGPLRTTLLGEQSETVVLCSLKAIFLSQTNPARSRGVLVLLIAILALVAFDYDDVAMAARSAVAASGGPGGGLTPSDHHPEGSHHGIISHLFYATISWFDVSDHKAGVLLLIAALLLQVAFNQSALSKLLVTEVGGTKRLRALSTCFSTLVLAPWAIFNIFSHDFFTVEDPLNLMHADDGYSWYHFIVPIVMMSLFIYFVDFYIESYVAQKTDAAFASKYSALFVFTCSLALSFVWNHPHVVRVAVMDRIRTVVEEEHALSWGVLVAYVLFVLSTNVLSKPLQTHKGSFIGYSAVGSPLYSLTGETLKRTSMSMLTVIKGILREIVTHTDSRHIFYFLCVNLAFTFVELTYGALSNSLGLISDGVHMLFDCSALVMGLFAAVVSQWKPTKTFSYGYGRLEILSGFVNGLFLVVISLFVFVEAVHRLFQPPEIKSEKLIYVSFAGLCVNMFGIVVFRHAHTHGGMACSGHDAPAHTHVDTQQQQQHQHSHSGGGGGSCSHGHGHSHASGSSSSHGHSHSHAANSAKGVAAPSTPSFSTADNDNMHGVFLHVLADTLGSVGVIVSSLLIQQFGWFIADPLCSLCIAVLILLSVMPLLKHSASVLLLRTPANKEAHFKFLLDRILNIEGVISYRDDHLWQLSSSTFVATLHVKITPDAYEQLVTSQINAILREMKLSNITVQIEKEVFFAHLSGLGASMGQIDPAKSVHKNMDSNTQLASFINIEKFIL